MPPPKNDILEREIHTILRCEFVRAGPVWIPCRGGAGLRVHSNLALLLGGAVAELGYQLVNPLGYLLGGLGEAFVRGAIVVGLWLGLRPGLGPRVVRLHREGRARAGRGEIAAVVHLVDCRQGNVLQSMADRARAFNTLRFLYI